MSDLMTQMALGWSVLLHSRHLRHFLWKTMLSYVVLSFAYALFSQRTHLGAGLNPFMAGSGAVSLLAGSSRAAALLGSGGLACAASARACGGTNGKQIFEQNISTTQTTTQSRTLRCT